MGSGEIVVSHPGSRSPYARMVFRGDILQPVFAGRADWDKSFPPGGVLGSWGDARLLCLVTHPLQISRCATLHTQFHPERHLYNRRDFKANRAAALAEWRQLGAA